MQKEVFIKNCLSDYIVRSIHCWFIALLMLLAMLPLLSAQEIGHTTVTFTDPSRGNRQIPTEIYYPATASGTNVPIAPGVFPLVVHGHGFVMIWSAYQNIWTALVPEGYIVAFPTTEGGFAPKHADFGLDLAFLVTAIQQQGAGAAVPAASVGTTSAIMGHSMGGGSSFLATADNPNLTTMISFAAANTNPSSIAAARKVAVPTLIFSGTNDCITPPPAQQDIMYDSTAAAYKTQVYITGGGHCYFADFNFNCSLGEATCSPSPSISREEQEATTADFLKLWLARYLSGDCSKGQAFQDSLAMSSRITYRQSESISCISGTEEHGVSAIPHTLFPNPLHTQLVIEVSSDELTTLAIYDLQGRLMLEQSFEHRTTVDTTSLEKGVYVYRLHNRNGNTASGKFIKN